MSDLEGTITNIGTGEPTGRNILLANLIKKFC